MATLGENLRTLLVASTGLAAAWPSTGPGLGAPHAIEQNTIPERPPRPRIWYQRDSEVRDLYVSGEEGMRRSSWDLEVIGPDDAVVASITAALKARLHGFDGAMGTDHVQLVEVEDHDDDYLFRGLASDDEAAHVAALRITIHTS